MSRICNSLLSLVFITLLAFTSACSTCVFSKGVERHTSLEELTITVTDPDLPTFEKVPILMFVEARNGVFDVSGGYGRPGEGAPEGIRNYYFFFRDTAIGTGSRIFDEPAGSVFEVSGVIPNEEGVNYRESTPTLDPDVFIGWFPANYSGTVRIIADDMVEFNMFFTDGEKLREVFAVYQFQSFETSTPTGNCD